MKPHTFAQMVNEVRDLARQYGQVEQFRCRVADLLGKYINVEHNSKGVPEQTEAPAVVVPEMMGNQGSGELMDAGRIERIRKEASEERRTLRGGDGLSSHFAGLCLELLEHVAEQGAQVSWLQAQLQSASYREVLNLRARAARLTPLEFLLAKGGDPMAQMAEAIRELSDKLNRSERAGSKVPMAPHVFAQMVNRVRDMAFDFGTCEQFRDRVSELLGEYVDGDGKAPGVVVPNLTSHELYTWGKDRISGYEECLSRLRAIPADRVLGDGMVQVSQEERLALGECSMVLRAYSKTHGIGVAAIERLDTIRANQGGAAT